MATSRWLHVVVLTAAVGTAGPHDAYAQYPWNNGDHEKRFDLELIKPVFAGDNDVSFATGTLFLTGRLPISGYTSVVASMPLAHGSAQGETSSALGNPYLGVEMGRPDGVVFVDAGAWIPLNGSSDGFDLATLVGVVSDADRIEAFAQETAAFSVGLNLGYRAPKGLFARGRLAPALWIATQDDSFRDRTEINVAYGGQIGYAARDAEFGLALTGRYAATGEGSFDDRSYHQLGLSGVFGAGSVRPSVAVRVPLDDDLKDLVDANIGIGLQVRTR